jgi:hypothetical protein
MTGDDLVYGIEFDDLPKMIPTNKTRQARIPTRPVEESRGQGWGELPLSRNFHLHRSFRDASSCEIATTWKLCGALACPQPPACEAFVYPGRCWQLGHALQI